MVLLVYTNWQRKYQVSSIKHNSGIVTHRRNYGIDPALFSLEARHCERQDSGSPEDDVDVLVVVRPHTRHPALRRETRVDERVLVKHCEQSMHQHRALPRQPQRFVALYGQRRPPRQLSHRLHHVVGAAQRRRATTARVRRQESGELARGKVLPVSRCGRPGLQAAEFATSSLRNAEVHHERREQDIENQIDSPTLVYQIKQTKICTNVIYQSDPIDLYYNVISISCNPYTRRSDN